MARKVYFGNATKQTWIDAPQTGMQAGSSGWVSEETLLNGEASIKRSRGSHRRFEMSWLGSMNATDMQDSLHTIKDFADGVHGDGPYFWNDPYATTTNMFAPGWATPAMSIDADWASMCPVSDAIQKETVLTSSITSLVGANTYSYPARTAKFTVAGGSQPESLKQTFYIPDGYTLWLGIHGHNGVEGGAFALPYNSAGVAGTEEELTMLGVNTGVRVNKSYSSTAAKKVEVYLAKVAPQPCVFHLVGMIAQLLPTGTSPATGNFISGRGTTGLEFTSAPQIEYYSAAINDGQIGMSATLVEV